MPQLEEAVAAVEIRLTPEECRQLEELYEPHKVLGF
jgi:aryl-alcohol dehydrogenase-like predicted oxidoreductase